MKKRRARAVQLRQAIVLVMVVVGVGKEMLVGWVVKINDLNFSSLLALSRLSGGDPKRF